MSALDQKVSLELGEGTHNAHDHFAAGAGEVHPAELQAMQPHSPIPARRSTVCRMSRRLRPSLSSFVTTNTSSGSRRSVSLHEASTPVLMPCCPRLSR